MRRYQRHFFLVFLLISIIYYAAPKIWQNAQTWSERYKTGEFQDLSGFVSSSLVYPIKPDHWLKYTIPKGTQQLRIITNGHINKPENYSLKNYWKYVLRYQLLDHKGKLILDKTYHQRSQLTAYKNDQGELFFSNYYSEKSLTPLDSRLILLSMSAIKRAKTIRISFTQQNPAVEEVAVRLYIPAKIAESGIANQWLRMSEKKKIALTKVNVYPHNLVSGIEKNNLLKNQWQPIGPDGIENQDYFSRTLYILREIEADKYIDSVVAAGLQIDSNHHGVIAIPEHGGKLSLQLKNLDGLILTSSAKVQLKWYGRLRDQRWTQQILWPPGQEKFNLPVQGGLIQITSNNEFLVHAILTTADNQIIDITPKPLIIRTYAAEQSVEYPVLHVNDEKTPFRLDVRKIYQPNKNASDIKLNYQWFDQQKQLIDSGSISINNLPSEYDRLRGKYKDLQVSDPVTYYFNVPSHVSTFKLSADKQGILVNAYNQPWKFNKNQRVPENAFFSLDKSDWFPSWFMLRPKNETQLIKHLAVRTVAGQYRPPEDSPVSHDNQYLWQEFRPQQTTEARHILTNLSKEFYRDQALPSVYCQLTNNQFHDINLKTYAKLNTLTPSLLYFRPKQNAFDFSILENNNTLLDKSAFGQQGIFKFPPISPGNHRIKLKTNGGGRWLMNYISACKTQAFIKRTVFKLTNRQLNYLYNNENNTEDKVLSARFFADNNTTERSVLEVEIEPLDEMSREKKQQQWTFTHRTFDIRAALGNPSSVLNSRGHLLNSGESFFIPLKRDLPPGLYNIKISLKQGASGYLTLAQLKHGFNEHNRFYWETNEQVN